MMGPRIKMAEIQPPRGGWTVSMEIKGQAFVFRGTPRTIVREISLVLKKNDEYNGDEDIWDYCNEIWCEREPTRCMRKTTGTDIRSSVVTFGHALLSLVKNGLQPVGLQQAKDRALVCLKCPQNKKLVKCSTCAKTTGLITRTLIGNRSTVYDKKLYQCGICRCELAQKIHYPMNEGDKNIYPDKCWVTQERKQIK